MGFVSKIFSPSVPKPAPAPVATQETTSTAKSADTSASDAVKKNAAIVALNAQGGQSSGTLGTANVNRKMLLGA